MNCPRCRAKGIQIKMKNVKRKGGFHKNTKFFYLKNHKINFNFIMNSFNPFSYWFSSL